MHIAAILFVLAALGGITILIMRVRGVERPPTWLALGHGAIAFSGLATLGYAYLLTPLAAPAGWALLLFLLAALGGATLFFGFHLRGRPLPIPIILGHGLMAATGLGLLLYAMYG